MWGPGPRDNATWLRDPVFVMMEFWDVTEMKDGEKTTR